MSAFYEWHETLPIGERDNAWDRSIRKEAWDAAMSAAAEICRKIKDDYHDSESHEWAELKNDAETGSQRCAEAIETARDAK